MYIPRCIRSALKSKNVKTIYLRTYEIRVRNDKQGGGIITHFFLFYFMHSCGFLVIHLIRTSSNPSILDSFFPFAVSRTALLPFIARPLFRHAVLCHCRHANCVIAYFNNVREIVQRRRALETNSHRERNVEYKRVDEIPVWCVCYTDIKRFRRRDACWKFWEKVKQIKDKFKSCHFF